MTYISVDDRLPAKQGIYTVKIKGNTGIEREAKAVYSVIGFSPIADNLIGDEYISYWLDE